MLSMPCWLFAATQPTGGALCNWIELLSYNDVTSESIITFHMWLLYVKMGHCICGGWWRGLSPSCSISQALGNLDGKGRASDAQVVFVLHPNHPVSETKPGLHAPPSASLPKARSDQLSAGEAQGREQIHSRQGMIFKNICSLQQIGRGFLAHIRPTIRKPNLLPLLFSHLYQPEKNKNTLFGEWEDGQREERRNNRSERIEIDIQANLLTQNCS